MTTEELVDPAMLIDAKWSEKEFQAEVIKLAKEFHYLCYHTYRSDRSAAGFPDLVLVRSGRVIFAELKGEKSRGKLSPAQEAWIGALKNCSGVETYVWWPKDMQDIVEILGR